MSQTSELPIVFENIGVAAGGKQILSEVNLTLAAGAPSVLIGPNGSGKTTVLRLAMGLLSPSVGRVTWNGSHRESFARRAFMFQRPTMLRRSAAANIEYALRAAGVARSQRQSRVVELLALTGLQGLADSPAPRLSGGEQQRLALARALARDPAVLFLDEPTTSLDPAGTKAFEDVIRMSVERGIKVVMATHDLGQAHRLGGKIILLHQGRVEEIAAAATFFKSPATLAAKRFLSGELLI